MTWNLDSSRPIYAQIAEQVRLDIISGLYQPGTKLSSVRELAAQAKVNPNTMQKALAELERSGLVHSMRTSGRFITEDTDMIKQMKEDLATDQIKEFLEKMSSMGFQPQDTLELIEKILKEEQP
ncbi:MAG: GntR family transcriptional regulator [Lachnospiraceae bacterium]|nr:GntR family transcriptional regulator [Lachnospiraceae bacterium]MCI9547200.1 GntR family transcriptional regulator [Lachnospiraceae bacterium]